jgi:energy-coupling factor transporter ATP-binding protein EcfA2
MIRKIEIDRFKSIEHVELNLGKVNVLVGANNSGKSSILQAIQFATSVAQTSQLSPSAPKFKNKDALATSVYPNQLIYSPVKDPYTLAKGGVLKEDEAQAICVKIEDETGKSVKATFRKGKNKNISANFIGHEIGDKLLSLENPFCMYVPGLAGIPFEEEIRPVGVVRRISAKGDSNTVFRNVLYRLFQSETWEIFMQDIRSIFPYIQISINAKEDTDGLVDVRFRFDNTDEYLPIDLAGTGILQAIQIAAYVNYFRPEILLLDEPDSHLHPDNQRLLASMMLRLADRDDTTIIISTHSRHLMAALREDATFFLVHDGCISADAYDHYAGLLELGALDEYDDIRNGRLQYVVLTEDSSPKSRRYLEKVFEASGFASNEYKIYSYNSISKIDSAKTFAQFLLDLNESIRVIVYRDRDGLYDNEVEQERQKIEFNERVKCIIAEKNDIEMYFCNKEHLNSICEKMGLVHTNEELQILIEEAIAECEEESKSKFYAHRVEIARRLYGNDTGAAMVEAEREFTTDRLKYMYGKKLSGVISSKLQQKFGQNINIFDASPAIQDERLVTLHSAA